MKRNESLRLRYEERREFRILTEELDVGVTEAMRPTDGWDPVPRGNPLGEHLTRRNADGLVHIPPGHIALQGDFSDMPPSTPGILK